MFTNTDAVTIGTKLYSAACERNQEPILNVLCTAFADAQTVLEIGSGSGQHAVYFGHHLPHVAWYTSDIAVNHTSIRAWLDEAQLDNVRPPVTLNMDDAPWSLREAGLDVDRVDAVFSSNTLHIVSWPQVVKFFGGVGALLNDGGTLCVYGPFKYDGQFTSAGDARFDALLRRQNAGSGLRDIAAVDELAQQAALSLIDDVLLPANNHLLVWHKE